MSGGGDDRHQWIAHIAFKVHHVKNLMMWSQVVTHNRQACIFRVGDIQA